MLTLKFPEEIKKSSKNAFILRSSNFLIVFLSNFVTMDLINCVDLDIFFKF